MVAVGMDSYMPLRPLEKLRVMEYILLEIAIFVFFGKVDPIFSGVGFLVSNFLGLYVIGEWNCNFRGASAYKNFIERQIEKIYTFFLVVLQKNHLSKS